MYPNTNGGINMAADIDTSFPMEIEFEAEDFSERTSEDICMVNQSSHTNSKDNSDESTPMEVEIYSFIHINKMNQNGKIEVCMEQVE